MRSPWDQEVQEKAGVVLESRSYSNLREGGRGGELLHRAEHMHAAEGLLNMSL
jgi:hypothetical protein